MTKDEIEATIRTLLDTNTLDTTVPWKSKIRVKVKVTGEKFYISKDKKGNLTIKHSPSSLDKFTVTIMSDPTVVILRNSKYPHLSMEFKEPIEWGAFIGMLLVDWNIFDKQEGEQQKVDQQRKEQLSLFGE